MLEQNHPWSKGEMNRVGKALTGTGFFDEEKYSEIILWHEDLLAEIYLAGLPVLDKYISVETPRISPEHIGPDFIFSSRIKNDGTIIEKLSRLKTNLARIQDFAGARLDLDCGPTAQYAIAEEMKEVFESYDAKVVIKNYLAQSQQGYRAVHLHITGNAGRVELQIRSHIQAKWANSYEALADVIGRKIRYEDEPEVKLEPFRKLVSSMKELSVSMHAWECSVDDARLNFSQALDLLDPDEDKARSIRSDVLKFSELTEAHRQELIGSMEGITRTLKKLKGSS